MKFKSVYLVFTAIVSLCLSLSVLSDSSVRLNLSQEQTEELELELEEELDNEESSQKKKTPKKEGSASISSSHTTNLFFKSKLLANGQLRAKHASKLPLFLLYRNIRIHIG